MVSPYKRATKPKVKKPLPKKPMATLKQSIASMKNRRVNARTKKRVEPDTLIESARKLNTQPPIASDPPKKKKKVKQDGKPSSKVTPNKKPVKQDGKPPKKKPTTPKKKPAPPKKKTVAAKKGEPKSIAEAKRMGKSYFMSKNKAGKLVKKAAVTAEMLKKSGHKDLRAYLNHGGKKVNKKTVNT
tara:strand:- start:902 stop:1456 length:555 start_codon:yes stop_codon:yes gene_type:complete